MKRIAQLMFLAALAVAGCKDDDKEDMPGINEPDATFADNAVIANQAEIDLGQLAKEKSSNQAVIAFGDHMVSEHNTALADLKNIINKRNHDMPTDLDAEHKQLKTRLQGLSGMEFDTAYVNSQVKDHQKVIEMFQNESNNGKDQDFKSYATSNLPHLNEHLSTAIQLQSALNVKAAAGGTN